MIHIYHTSSAELARKSVRQVSICAAVSLGCVLTLMAWTCRMQHVYISYTDDCNFNGIIFQTEENPKAAPPRAVPRFVEHPLQPITALPPLPDISTEQHINLPELQELIEDYEEENDEAAHISTATLAVRDFNDQTAPGQAKAETKEESLYTPPSYQNCPCPPYPPHLRQRRIEGTVHVLIHISAQGEPTDVLVTQSSGYATLDSHTRSWILKHWKFHPALKAKLPHAAQIRTSINYTLRT